MERTKQTHRHSEVFEVRFAMLGQIGPEKRFDFGLGKYLLSHSAWR